ncbi:bifunctional glutamate N-acetyltransferase/amino-acid acetyltransferase ArgJ [Arhodomonas sp. SL1]|uniref:bifunctional glutamate N-acetyltransferase/amino-acid acetyltransferase ArgJ n=1 Tax=Arhodomonas sp. SL1 TaxID=3425691 RepID=UPI003F88112B
MSADRDDLNRYLAPEFRFADGASTVAGTAFSVAETGMKYRGRTDAFLVAFPQGASVGGVFTQSACPGAPVDWCRGIIGDGRARGLFVNAGNANVFNGPAGLSAAERTAQLAAHGIGCAPEEVFLASTGVIGEPLDMSAFEQTLPGMSATLGAHTLEDAARAMMTTDTHPKGSVREIHVGGAQYRVAGIAKGSGMVAPNMATTLAFLFTDAPVEAAAIQQMLRGGVDDTFNAISIDSDTSTSDMILMFATGRSGNIRRPVDSDVGALVAGVNEAVHSILRDLALQVVRDGEGASRLIEVEVTGAKTKASARRVAFSIANSPLVKTAVGGRDANWGRVVMAVGKSGEPIRREALGISFGDIAVAEAGRGCTHIDESALASYMDGEVVAIRVFLGVGAAADRVYTCDLTEEYVRANGHYRS